MSKVNNLANLPENEVQNLINSVPENQKEQNYLEIGVRPWGVYYVLEDKDNYKVKKIVVNAGHRLSLQSHQHRSEHWICVSGNATVEIESSEKLGGFEKGKSEIKTFNMPPNESCFIRAGAKHRLSNRGKIPVVLIEVQVGEYTGEDDIERFEDDYKRVE
jgi:mannose-1-phosphate guanylyltransferase